MSTKKTYLALAVLFATLPTATLAQAPSASTDDAADDLQTLAPINIQDTKITDRPMGSTGIDKRQLPAKRTSTSDTAQLLEDVPGMSSYGAGGISSLPVLHGMADDRLRVQVDGMDLASACPNHMNPALSFIDPTKVASIDVYAGITPVSAGGDSIGGTIQVKSAPPKFARPDEGILFSGNTGTFHRSNGGAEGYNFGATVAGEQLSVSYSESRSSSNNYKAAGEFKKPGVWQKLGDKPIDAREVASSEYGGSVNQDFGVAMRLTPQHLVSLNVSEQRLDYSGFPNQRMDMVYSHPDSSDTTAYLLSMHKPSNTNKLVNLRYTGQFEWVNSKPGSSIRTSLITWICCKPASRVCTCQWIRQHRHWAVSSRPVSIYRMSTSCGLAEISRTIASMTGGLRSASPEVRCAATTSGTSATASVTAWRFSPNGKRNGRRNGYR